MMENGEGPSDIICNSCGEAFKLPDVSDEKADENLPRMLLCGHIFCTNCLVSIQHEGVIICPDCEIKSTLPEEGVYGLQEDSRIIGLIYTARVNQMRRSKGKRKKRLPQLSTDLVEELADIEKIEKTIDESLYQAEYNLAQLEDINETLKAALLEQVKKEKIRVKIEIMQASNKAKHAVQKWKEMQLNRLANLEAQCPCCQAVVSDVQERIKVLANAMQMAREVRRAPILEQYFFLDKLLETLQTPVDQEAFELQCINEGRSVSYVFQSENLSNCLKLSIKMESNSSNTVSMRPLENHQSDIPIKNSSLEPGKDQNGCSSSPSRKLPLHENCKPNSILTDASSTQSSHQEQKSTPKISLSQYSSFSDLSNEDVIVEDVLGDYSESVTPTGPSMASIYWRSIWKQKNDLSRNKVTQWVVVSHVVNPSYFYVRPVVERKESKILSQRIKELCCGDGCLFTLKDIIEKGSIVFMKGRDGQWCRGRVVEVFQNTCEKSLKVSRVSQLSGLRVFLLDYGAIKYIPIKDQGRTDESTLNYVNCVLRKVDEHLNEELSHIPPLAIRCSLKDLVPYNLAAGWSKEAKTKFCSVVGSAAVEMRPLGKDRVSLLVDLRKAPMDQPTDVSISVREYLVFIEVARFYSPVILGRRSLMYYPPVYPKANTECDAVVCHINNASDFYIQLVDNMESLLLTAKLQDCYNSLKEDELRIYCPEMGEACVACFQDNMWYRAQIEGHPRGQQVEVRYVDFGNKEVLSVSDLRKIKDEFFVLPAMALHCCLADVVPSDGKSWSEASILRFANLAHQKLVTVVAAEVPQAGPFPLSMFVGGVNEPKSNIAEVLVLEDLACFKNRRPNVKKENPSGVDSALWDPPLELCSVADKADAPDQKTEEKEKSKAPLELQPKSKQREQHKDLKVTVTHVNSPSSFYVRLTDSDSELQRVCELVEQECAQKELQDVEWKADMHCAANINGVWERGQMCCDVTSNTAEVRLCDHGNIMKIHVSNLRPLPPSLIGSLVLECTLSDIRPTGGQSTWTKTACDVFSTYLAGTVATMTIKEVKDGPPFSVELHCSNRTGKSISIADFLEKPKETDARTPASDPKTEKKEENNSPPPSGSHLSSFIPFSPAKLLQSFNISTEKVKTSVYHPPELPRPGHILVSISAVGDDGLIYARTQNAENQLKQLRDGIQKSIKTLPKQKSYTWKSVKGCAVFGSDMLWYRGQLLELLGGHVKVQYVDSGAVENIPVVHVYPMLLCVEVPQLCVPCQLLGTNPVGGKWHHDGVALMKEVLLNRTVDLQVVELPADPRGPVTVEIFVDGMSLSRILCHHQHASIDWTLSTLKGVSPVPPAPILDEWDFSTEGLADLDESVLGSFVNPDLPLKGERFRVRVTHLLTPNELFLRPVKETEDPDIGETLDEALLRINANISSLQDMNSFQSGAPCLAEYSDGRFYRARLMTFTSIEPLTVSVQHVDYGSDDSLPISKLRQMPAELLQFPTQVIKVKVAGFKAPSVKQSKDVLPYSPEWSVKAVIEMTDLLHGNLIATVVSEEPELTVLLNNEEGGLVHLPLVNSGLAELC
ncbi:PREDICTED: RING finger protein 17 [Cyprinodon variegatus]|uniref:RING finger protein 17 n=1 Tax=Cyprinodon variegatus TaxID=28743 RepID=UPI000742AA71|nr:PREDICTED: RING finger protein 17 [Cyprinodon variegatus]